VPPGVRSARVPSSDGTLLAVYESGTEAGPPVVIANGLGGSILALRALLAHFAGSYRFVSWDYRGLYGSSRPADRRAVRIEDHVRDMEVVVARTAARPAVLMGWSMGVQVAVQYALDHPEDVAGLALVCGAPGDPFAGVFGTTASRRIVPLVCRAVEASPAPFGMAVRALAAFPPAPEVLRRAGVVAPSCDLELLRELGRRIARLDWRVYCRSTRAMGAHDATVRLGEIAVPLLAVGGGRDMITPAAVAVATAAAAPAGESFVVEGATHYLPLEFPDVLNDRIGRFLADRVGSTGAGWRREEAPDVVEPVGRRPRP
jgi:pimeloyl-ACP methyl ester carboxylesterase